MRILLDTHIFIWCLQDSPRIKKIKALILSDETEIYVSAASFWEMAIKISIGKLEADLKEIRHATLKSEFIELPITIQHTETLMTLEPHHKDPFDRMIVAQAITEPMRLLSHDKILSAYSNLVEIV